MNKKNYESRGGIVRKYNSGKKVNEFKLYNLCM